jgi:hypothetical protein
LEEGKKQKWDKNMAFLKEKKDLKEVHEVESIQESDQLLSESFLFYLEEYGDNFLEAHDKITEQSFYLKADSEETARAIHFLNISSQQEDLFWLGRAFTCLPLPPLWKCVQEYQEQGTFYLFTLSKTLLRLHPSYKYILFLISRDQALRIQNFRQKNYSDEPFFMKY